jgi:hypothetical protein
LKPHPRPSTNTPLASKQRRAQQPVQDEFHGGARTTVERLLVRQSPAQRLFKLSIALVPSGVLNRKATLRKTHRLA